jgi:hypothetical protein
VLFERIDKLEQAIQVTLIALAHTSIFFELAESLGSFLSFCADVIQFGRVYK